MYKLLLLFLLLLLITLVSCTGAHSNALRLPRGGLVGHPIVVLNG